jgi:hypothetical protein
MSEKISSPESFERLPGLLRSWEIERVLEPGADFHIEEAGAARDGTPLFAVYRRGPERHRSPNAGRLGRGGPSAWLGEVRP